MSANHHIPFVVLAIFLAACGSTTPPAPAEPDPVTTQPPPESALVLEDESTPVDPASEPQTEAVTVQLNETEHSMVGTWQLTSLADPDRVMLGQAVGDTCTFAADLSLDCTIAGASAIGYWAALDPVEVDELSLSAHADWVFESGRAFSSGTHVVVEGSELTLATDRETWTLVDRPAGEVPHGELMDEATEQLVGTWTLVSQGTVRLLDKLVVPGDSCTFDPGHSVVCDGENDRSAIWRTRRSWPEGSSHHGNSLEIRVADRGVLFYAGSYEIVGDTLTWDVEDSEWVRAN